MPSARAEASAAARTQNSASAKAASVVPTGMSTLQALADGETDPAALATLAVPQVRRVLNQAELDDPSGEHRQRSFSDPNPRQRPPFAIFTNGSAT